MGLKSIRNFSIIAHIDHGKSTLADRFLLLTGAIGQREFREQVLDDMDLERERGITIKARAVALQFENKGRRYLLNLIDTPGHVDFSYEVSRSLAACEGAVLVVDAVKGVEAQTVANAALAFANDLRIIPVINKIDLSRARVDEVAEEMAHILGVDREEIIAVSAKTGENVARVLEAIVERVPAPQAARDKEAPLRALIFDSAYDEYRGVIVYIRLFDGQVEEGDEIRIMKAGRIYQVGELGKFSPEPVRVKRLAAGEVGYLIASIKSIEDVRVGDTITLKEAGKVQALAGYEEPLPMVYCGLYPVDGGDFENLRSALARLKLNDSSFIYEPEVSDALGFGFRAGFLGLLHMEIVQERLERESSLELVKTAPNVTYEVLMQSGELEKVESSARLPETKEIAELREPLIRASMVIPARSVGALMGLSEERRGKFISTEYLSENRVVLTYDLPLSEVIYDFYDKLKSATQGYGSMDYEFLGYQKADLVRLDILVAGKKVDALSAIVHRTEAERKGRALVKKLRSQIPRHLFEIPIQAAIGSRIIARESIKPLAKNVTGKCYGGDITRKRKLWAKQKAGKKRLKMVGQVEIPQEAFLAVLGGE
jgi:GTP-binding protein LepA